jgi:hypothetical protein
MHARSTIALSALIVAAGLAGAAGVWRAGGEGIHAAAAENARRVGFELRETKEELKLDYTVEAQDNGGGRASVTFTLADEGRIKPITTVQIAVPSADKSGYYDVVASLAPFERDGKKVYVVQLTRELLERGEFDLKTKTMDGKSMLNWGYHRVPLAAAMKAAVDKAALEKAKELNVGGPAAAPAPKP